MVGGELLLTRVLHAGTPRQRQEATARLASLYRDAREAGDAARLYRELSGPLAEAVCLDGKRGRELAAAIPADDPVRRVLDGVDPWPAGEVKKRVKDCAAPRRSGKTAWSRSCRLDWTTFSMFLVTEPRRRSSKCSRRPRALEIVLATAADQPLVHDAC